MVNENPEVVEGLTATLRKFVENGRSPPGAKQENHGGATWWRGLPWPQPG